MQGEAAGIISQISGVISLPPRELPGARPPSPEDQGAKIHLHETE